MVALGIFLRGSIRVVAPRGVAAMRPALILEGTAPICLPAQVATVLRALGADGFVRIVAKPSSAVVMFPTSNAAARCAVAVDVATQKAEGYDLGAWSASVASSALKARAATPKAAGLDEAPAAADVDEAPAAADVDETPVAAFEPDPSSPAAAPVDAAAPEPEPEPVAEAPVEEPVGVEAPGRPETPEETRKRRAVR